MYKLILPLGGLVLWAGVLVGAQDKYLFSPYDNGRSREVREFGNPPIPIPSTTFATDTNGLNATEAELLPEPCSELIVDLQSQINTLLAFVIFITVVCVILLFSTLCFGYCTLRSLKALIVITEVADMEGERGQENGLPIYKYGTPLLTLRTNDVEKGDRIPTGVGNRLAADKKVKGLAQKEETIPLLHSQASENEPDETTSLLGGPGSPIEANVIETPEVPVPRIPEVLIPEAPEVPVPKIPEVPVPETPEVPAPETPQVPAPETPDVPAPETPELSVPELPKITAPEIQIPLPGPLAETHPAHVIPKATTMVWDYEEA